MIVILLIMHKMAYVIYVVIFFLIVNYVKNQLVAMTVQPLILHRIIHALLVINISLVVINVIKK